MSVPISKFEGAPQSEFAPTLEHAVDCLDQYLADANADDQRLLYDRQVEVMADLRGFLIDHADEPYGYISLPTGVGKTVLFTELVKATGLRTLVLTPTKLLINQTEAAFSKFGDEDISIGKVYSGEKNGDEQITLTTYASFVRHTKRGDSPHIAPGQYDLIILDEAHRALAAETRKALASYPDAIQIGFTATEDYSERRRLRSLLPHQIHKMSIKEAIEHSLIAPFTNVLVETDVDASDIRVNATNEYEAGDLEKVINTDKRNGIALELYLKHFRGMKTIIFCNGVNHAQAVADLFRNGGVSALAVHGGLSTDAQTEAKAAFAYEGPYGVDVLTNDKLLAEGFDVPSAAVCINLSPTLSRVRAQQRGGRVLRLDPARPNKHAYIVDFVDQNYRKPPVLFSDPKVAELAQIGNTATSIFANLPSDEVLIGGKLVTDAQKVTDTALQFFESHKVERQLPPDNWLSIMQISALYKVDKTIVRSELDRISESLPDLMGGFHNPHSSSRTKRNYYHPDAVRNFAYSRGLNYIDFETVFPAEWVTRESLEEQYSPKVLKTMFHFARLLHGGISSDHRVVHNGVEYLSPTLLKVLEDGAKPNGFWKPVEPLLESFGFSEDELEALCKTISKKENILDGMRPCWWLVEGQELMHVSPVAFAELEKALIEQRDNDTLELTDGAVINLRPARPDQTLDLLYRVFDMPSVVRGINKTTHKRSNDLDAIYSQNFEVLE